jgi:serine/threonine protein kinase/tetratricopeptide (TPR) repeat protein
VVDPKADEGATTRQLRLSLEHRLFGSEERSSVGRYELVEPIGRGGMGTVFLARDPSLSRDVAVKVLSGAEIGSERSALLPRLVREAKLLARLSHPNVVAVYDVGEQGDDVFIAMEYVQGQTLRAWLDTAPASPRARISVGMDLLLDAGRGLAAAHAIGVVHRDFKPDNVLVGDDRRVRVVDFGLARGQLDSDVDSRSSMSLHSGPTTLTATGQLAGTPAYMAPEQFAGGSVTTAADQYAFCLTLFELVYGRRPFAGVSVDELARRVQSEDVRVPEMRGVPRRLRRILARGLEREPGRRYPDLETLLGELHRWRNRRRLTNGAMLLGAGALVGGAIALSVAPPQPPPSCSDVTAPIDELWTPAAAQEIEASFIATDRSYAGASATRVVAAMDEFAARWRLARIDACEDTLVRGEYSTDVMDRRVACLQRGVREAAALVEIWRSADGAVVDAAMAVAGQLPATDPCAQIDVLATIAPLPSDPDARATIAEIEDTEARVRALMLARRLPAAAALLEGLPARAEATGHAPTIARVLHMRANLEDHSGDIEASGRSLHAAIAMALRGGDDRVAAHVASLLADQAIAYARDPERALEWLELGRSLAARVGGDPWVEAMTTNTEGQAYVQLGRKDEALAALERALQLHRARGEEHDVIAAMSSMGGGFLETGELARAQEMFERAIAARRALYGEDHSGNAMDLTALGIVHQRRAELAEAERALGQALQIEERVLGRDHPAVAYTLQVLGGVLIESDANERAVAPLERALAIRAATLGDESVVTTETRRSLATAYLRSGRHDEGKLQMERAVAAARVGFPAGSPELAQTLAVAAEDFAVAGDLARARELGHEAFTELEGNARASTQTRALVLVCYARVLVEARDATAREIADRAVRELESDPEANPKELAAARELQLRARALTR